MCIHKKGVNMTKPPKRVKVILGPDKPTGELKKWMKKQEKLRRKIIDREVAKEDARRLAGLRKKRRNG